MRRFVHTLAMLATAAVLATGIWRGSAVLPTLQRAALTYLVAFLLAGGLVLAVRLAGPASPPEPEEVARPHRRRGGRQNAPAGDPE